MCGMAIPNSLNMVCTSCKVANTCPKKGSSPLILPNKRQVMCRILGGYGRKPVDLTKLSSESKAIIERDGPCLTIAEVPAFDTSSGHVYFNTVKIFSEPILHSREKLAPRIQMMYPQSYKGNKAR